MDLLPLQPPDAAQLVVSVLDQESVVLCPAAMTVGLALNEREGTGGGGGVPSTVTRAVSVTVPPGPLHVSE